MKCPQTVKILIRKKKATWRLKDSYPVLGTTEAKGKDSPDEKEEKSIFPVIEGTVGESSRLDETKEGKKRRPFVGRHLGGGGGGGPPQKKILYCICS